MGKRKVNKSSHPTSTPESTIKSASPTKSSKSPQNSLSSNTQQSIDQPIISLSQLIQSSKLKFFALIEEEDLPYEEICLKHKYSVKAWLNYLNFKQDSSHLGKIFLFERAVKQLPGSYKLWVKYLDYRLSNLINMETGEIKVSLKDKEWEKTNQTFENSLILMNKMPIIWLKYLAFLNYQNCFTKIRKTFDEALRALPLTQHKNVWNLYLEFANKIKGETSIRIWNRYLKFNQLDKEDFISHLIEIGKYGEACKQLISICELPKFHSKYSKSQYQLWLDLCDLLCEHSEEIELELNNQFIIFNDNNELGKVGKLNIEKILRGGIKKYKEQVGKLWTSLAKWWTIKGEFEKAKDVYEEGLNKIITVRDFTIIFDSYAEFEESIISMKMQILDQLEENNDNNENDIEELQLDIDLRLEKLEQLMERRPFLINNVLLKQNPHNCNEWLKRIKLYQDKNDNEMIVKTFTKALKTIDPKKSIGKLPELWLKFSEFYESQGDLDTAREILEKAIKVNYKSVDELADIWCMYSELELKNGNIQKALDLMARATTPIISQQKLSQLHYDDTNISIHTRLIKSIKLWSFYCDLEESFGTIETTKIIYDRIMELKIITPQILCNYALFLWENNYFEESFKIYERGIEIFNYPAVYDLWTIYLNQFMERYGGSKLERLRDLFEQALDKMPSQYCKNIYVMYAKAEEEFGLIRRSMRIYDRVINLSDLPDEDKFELYKIYINKIATYFGLPATREIYQKALSKLPDNYAQELGIQFINLEIKLGEIDRARIIFGYCSQLSDPRNDEKGFWKKWHEFEVSFGNEDTFKEMLRIKRSIQAKLNTDIHYISNQITKDLETHDTMETLEKEILKELNEENITPANMIKSGVQFVKAVKTQLKPKGEINEDNEVELNNPDEIVINDDDDDDSSNDDEEDLPDKNEIITNVPDSVFGGLKESQVSKPNEEILGAKERLKRKR